MTGVDNAFRWVKGETSEVALDSYTVVGATKDRAEQGIRKHAKEILVVTAVVTALVMGVAALQLFAGGGGLKIVPVGFSSLVAPYSRNVFSFVQWTAQGGLELGGVIFSAVPQCVHIFVKEYAGACQFVNTAIVPIIMQLARPVLVWGTTLYAAYHSVKGVKALYESATNMPGEGSGVIHCIKTSVLKYKLVAWILAPIGLRVSWLASFFGKKCSDATSASWIKIQSIWQSSQEATASLWAQARDSIGLLLKFRSMVLSEEQKPKSDESVFDEKAGAEGPSSSPEAVVVEQAVPKEKERLWCQETSFGINGPSTQNVLKKKVLFTHSKCVTEI